MKSKIATVIVLALVMGLITQSVSADQWLFQEQYISYPVGNGLAVGVGDFNSDGLNDIAMTTSNADLFVFLQQPDGSLANPPAHFYTPGEPWSLSIGDLNNDGRSDIAVSSFSENVVSVYYQGTGGNLIGQIVSYTTDNSPDAIAVGDVNGDGLDDIAVSHWNAPHIGVFAQTPSGSLSSMITYDSPQAGYDDIEITDVNHDGKNDVVKMNGLGEYPSLSIYLQDANGALAPETAYPLTSCASYDYCLGHSIGIGDVTGDGIIDIVLGYSHGGTGSASEIAVFAQDSDGRLQVSNSYSADPYPEAIQIADVNSDGFSDVLATYAWQMGMFLQQNGSLTPHAPDYIIPYAHHYKPQGLAIGDINNDSQPDLAIASHGLAILYHTESTPPIISATAENEDGTPYIPGTWTNQTVIVKYTCSDAESGIASCPDDQVFDTDGIMTEITGTATDNAGNRSSVSFGPIQIDKTPPVVFMDVSANPVLLNGSAELLRNASDSLSGIDNGPCMNIDTSTVGFKSVTCYIYDHAGNTTEATANYQVIYDFDGFLSPVDDCINNPCEGGQDITFKPGSTIPLKFQLKDANGEVIQASNDPLWLVPVQFDFLPVILPDDFDFQVSVSTYEWRKNHHNYVYEWSTKGLPNESIWAVGVKLDDGMTYYVFVALVK